MVRPKNNQDMQEQVEDVSVFPDGYQMNAWENNEVRGLDIAASRTREHDARPISRSVSPNRGKLWFPIEEIPEDLQYGWFTERLLNDPQGDNLQEAYEDGWDFVDQTDHPTYSFRALYGNTDNRIRRSNNILMKKRKEDYQASQRGWVEESKQKQREISNLTDYFGSSPTEPRFVVENSGSYTPSYTNKRG